MAAKLPKLIFITESIRRDIQAPLQNFKRFEIVHFYLNAPYGDMSESDLRGCRKVEIGSLLSEIVAEQPDIIQGVEPFGSRLGLRLSRISQIAKKRTKAKLVCPVFENRPIKERFSTLQRIVLRLFCPGFFRSCDMIFALNSGAVRNIKYYARSAKIITGLPWGIWGVDTKTFRPMGKKTKNQIVFIGRWVKEKGIMFLLEAFRGAKNKIPSLTLNLIGQGPLEEAMRNYVKDNIISSVNFIGFAKSDALTRYFARAELSVYPSITTERWEEQVGTVNLQSLSCSTPVLTTKSGAIPEYIKEGEGAILVRERSARELEEAIVHFFQDEVFREKLTKSAREYAMKYDIKKEIKEAEKYLEEILSEN